MKFVILLIILVFVSTNGFNRRVHSREEHLTKEHKHEEHTHNRSNKLMGGITNKKSSLNDLARTTQSINKSSTPKKTLNDARHVLSIESRDD